MCREHLRLLAELITVFKIDNEYHVFIVLEKEIPVLWIREQFGAHEPEIAVDYGL